LNAKLNKLINDVLGAEHSIDNINNYDDMNIKEEQKKLDSMMFDPSSFLTINDTASIADTGHYLSGYDVYNHNNEINPVYYPLSTSGINHDRFKLAKFRKINPGNFF
jgi:Na+-transporting NADH:ubiquinone oxidoreductase subunit NqrC